MEQIVIAIVTPVVESVMVPVKKHILYLISCTKYVADMSTKMRVLNDTRLGVEDHENQNKSNSLKVPKEVKGWLEEVGKIDAQVKSIDSINVGSCFDLKGRHKLGSKVCKIIQDIDRLMEEKSMIDWTDIPIPPAEVNSTSTPSSDYNDFESREPTYAKAFNALKADSKSHMIALCGMGGVGKTIMTKKLKKIVSGKEMFDFIIEVSIGEQMDVSVIQKAIAEQLAIDLNESSKEARVIKLRNGFEAKSDHGKKKFLVILDDIWECIDLNDLGLSPKPNQGIDFKVLLTSRDRNVCIMMGVELDSILNLKVIEDSEAQEFFLQIVKISDDDDLDLDLRKMGDDIATRCHGLPIAIKTIARTLKGKSKHVWEDTLSKLEHKDVHEVVRNIFAMSYKNLHDEETRLTLLLCGLFPEDFDTPTEDLVRYAWGLKLFRNVDFIREARNRLNTCIDRLVHANLLIQSQEFGCVKMHDLVRSFVLDVCSEREIVGKWPAKPMSEHCKMISLICAGMHDFPRIRKYPNLLLLKLMHGEESLRFPEDFYEEMERLEVIAYNKMEYPLNLRSLQCSANLRALCLHQCSFMIDCSSIGNLLNLEVLSFADSSIHQLPSTIVNLKELKLLDLTGCRYLCVDHSILKSLVKLNELYMRGTRGNGNDEGDELVECSKTLDALEIEFFDKDALPQNMSFKNLKRFRISLGCHILDKINGLSRYSFENTLILVTNECGLLDSGMNELIEKTKVLYLRVDGINDLGYGLGASMHNLRVLDMCKCTNLRYLFTIHVVSGLKQLESLKIEECPLLETLVHTHENGEVEVIKFLSLKFLSLKELPMLMSLCKLGGNIIEFPQLEELVLDDLPNFSSIYQDFLKKEVMSSKLKNLKISKMEKLKEIWPSQMSNNVVSQLRMISVERCDSVVNLFPSNPMSLFQNLEQLTVNDCGSIEVIFTIDLGSHVVHELEQGNNNLRYIKVRGLGKLREVWRVKGVVNSNLPILGFQSVESIEIRECKRLRNVFTPTTSNFDMRSLKKITIDDIDGWGENKSNNEETNVISNQDISEADDDIHNVAFPSYLLHNFHQLHTLELISFKEADVVFKIDSSTCRKLATTSQKNEQLKKLLPHLKDLELIGMKRMTQPELKSSSFHNITSITLESCDRIKYLFSPLMTKLLSNLISIEISRCNVMEEVVSNIDGEYKEMAVSFPHLVTLELQYLPCLKCIDGVGNNSSTITTSSTYDKSQCYQVGVAYWSSYQYAKIIRIWACDALLTLIPSHAVGRMPNLENLMIFGCTSMREIFEIEGINKDDVNIGDTGTIPRSINMTNSLELPNLKTLQIWRCNSLRYIFTSSVVESLKKLERLEIKDCDAIQVIVKEDNGEHIIGLDDVVFPRLKSFTLTRLPNLKGFFLGKNDFRWPSLDEVEIYGCPQMMIFTSGHSMAPKLKYINTGFGKHSLECGLNFDWTNAPHEENQLDNSSTCSTSDVTKYLQFPWSFSNLIELDVGMFHELHWEKTIFPINELVKGTNDETQSTDDDEDVIHHLSNKKQLVMSMDHPPTSSSSPCIWNINSYNFLNLTKVSLQYCHFLEHVFSYGMAATLVQLQHLHISECNKLKVILQDSANEVVSFPCLKSIQLTHLNSLKGFCLGNHDEANFEWPSLHTLKIIDCREITVFTNGQSTTPKLKVVGTSFGLCEVKEDLSSFIKTKLQEGYKF